MTYNYTMRIGREHSSRSFEEVIAGEETLDRLTHQYMGGEISLEEYKQQTAGLGEIDLVRLANAFPQRQPIIPTIINWFKRS
jgi:hypothetical protein